MSYFFNLIIFDFVFKRPFFYPLIKHHRFGQIWEQEELFRLFQFIRIDNFVNYRGNNTMNFKLESPYKPQGDQPKAIKKLTDGWSVSFFV